jgi:hypothetical protein
MLKAQREKRMDDYNKIFNELKARTEREDVAASPLLEEKDLKLIAGVQAGLT